MANSQFVYDVTAENFEARILNASFQTPVFVDFWAPWCGPCRMLSPVLDKLADEYAGKFTVAKINTDDEQMLAMQFGIRSIPNVKIFKDGKLVDEFVGAQPEGVIRQLIDRHAGKPKDNLRDQAAATLASGNPARAAQLLQQAVDAEPDNAELKVDLADALLRAGSIKQVQQILDDLPANIREGDAAKTLAARLEFASAAADAPDTASLARQVASAPDDLQARYLLGVRRLVAGDYEAGLDQFFEVMKRDRKFEDDLGRKSLVAAFKIIDDPELINRYRQRMTAFLF
ncbi:MAG: thioredoxin [Gammaproteobacteria bacterium]